MSNSILGPSSRKSLVSTDSNRESEETDATLDEIGHSSTSSLPLTASLDDLLKLFHARRLASLEGMSTGTYSTGNESCLCSHEGVERGLRQNVGAATRASLFELKEKEKNEILRFVIRRERKREIFTNA